MVGILETLPGGLGRTYIIELFYFDGLDHIVFELIGE